MRFEKIYEIFVSIFFLVLIAGMASFAQLKGMVYINLKKFKVIKIKKFKFMFKAMYGGDVEKDGVIVPTFVYQIFSPLLSIVCCVIIIALSALGYDFTLCFIILFCALGVDFVFFILLNLVLFVLNKYKNEKTNGEEASIDKSVLKIAAMHGKLARLNKGTKKYDLLEQKIKLHYEGLSRTQEHSIAIEDEINEDKTNGET